ncbi:MAG: hypothetical protein GXO76_15665 [Calditrichaeota bacterium]|nr:hypothetical protein [Calditrichota bacterium]
MMKSAKMAVLIFALLTVGCHANKNPLKAEGAHTGKVVRLPGSPYPVSQSPQRLFVVDDAQFSRAQILAIETLQGVVAQTRPEIYRVRGPGYARWLQNFQDDLGVRIDETYRSDFEGLFSHFKNRISGYFLCNPNDASVNVAISLCGVRQGVAATPETRPVLDRLGIPLLGDVRGEGINNLIQGYSAEFSRKGVCYQRESMAFNLADFAVFGRFISFFAPISGAITKEVFDLLEPNSPLLGWGDDEFQLVQQSSRHALFVHPADWAINLSTLSNFSAELHQQTPVLPQENTAGDFHTVCFVMTDGDNIQWLLNDFSTDVRWYGSPDRGKIPLGWTISPAMSELAPTVMKFFYETAANSKRGRDYFIAAPSGLGYVYPDRYSDLAGFSQLTARFMKKSDLHILNIIGNDRSTAFLKPFLQYPEVDAIFYYDYSNYSGGNGRIDWIAGKPVISGRYNLWKGFETPASLSAKLNALPKNSHSPDGYSLIPVHVWSNGVAEVLACVKQLGTNVQVVAPDRFVQLIVQNLKPGK